MFLKLPLRFVIPVIVLLASMVVLPLSLLTVAPFIERQHEESLRAEARNIINHLQETLTYMLHNRDEAGIHHEIELSGRHDNVSRVLIVALDGDVIFSSSSDDHNKSLSELADLKIAPEQLRAMAGQPGPQYSTDDREMLYALSRLELPVHASLPSLDSSAMLILELRKGWIHTYTWRELQFLLVALSVSILILALILMLALHLMVTSRIRRLVSATHNFMQGDRVAYAHFKGQDELGALGRAFNKMAGRITEVHRQLEANADLLDELLKNSPAMIVIRDTQGRYLRANPAYLDFVGVSSMDQLVGKQPQDVLAPNLAHDALEGDKRVIQSGRHYSWEGVHECPGGVCTLYSERFPLFDDEGQIYSVCSIITDLTARAEREKSLKLARYIFETTHDGIIVTDLNNLIVDVNPAFEKVTEYSRDEVIGHPPSILSSNQQTTAFYENMWREIDSDGIWSGEIWNKTKSGNIFPELLTIKSIQDESGNINGYFGVFTDISEQKKTENSLRSLAYYDSLTQLANRTLCQDRLAHDMELSDRHGESLALVFIDLDFFKHVNDSLGHEYGDQLLLEVAERIKSHVRSSDTVARWGGDEFILILPGIFEETMAQVVAGNVLAALKKPFQLKNSKVYIGASIGIAIYPNDADDAETLIRHADAAMYSAKSRGRDQICFFDPELNRKNLYLIQMKTDIRRALDQDEFSLCYQPKICLLSNQIIGFEALLRWNPEGQKPVSPAVFIPVAESSGLIVPLGDWVLASVCAQVSAWIGKGLINEGQRVSINLSPRQLSHPGLLAQIREALAQYEGINAYLSVEITETAVIENIQKTLPVLQELRDMGLKIELDDFGSGYSSLSYLRRLPVDILKVDKAFTAELENNESERAIMASIINMAHNLGISVVAEGVEQPRQLDILRSQGCDYAQGFYFSKPLPAADIELMLHEEFVLE